MYVTFFMFVIHCVLEWIIMHFIVRLFNSRLQVMTSTVWVASASRLRGSSEPLGTMLPWCTMGFQSALNGSPMMPRGASHSPRCTPNRTGTQPWRTMEAPLRHINCRNLTLESGDKLTNMSSSIQNTTYFSLILQPIQGSNPAIFFCYFNTEGRLHRTSLDATYKVLRTCVDSDGKETFLTIFCRTKYNWRIPTISYTLNASNKPSH